MRILQRLRELAGIAMPRRAPPEISFVARQDNLGPMQNWLTAWAPELQVNIFTYEALPPLAALAPGLWIFADIDRLTPTNREIGVAAWEGLQARYGKRVRLLNRPGVSLTRRQLLNRLHETGRNRFAIYEAADWRKVTRFPVFVRLASEHIGALTPLLHDEDALRNGVAEVQAMGHPLDNMLVVEFIDTAVDGIYRKFAMFRAGDLFLAQHVFHAPDWHVKGVARSDDTPFLDEDRVYRETAPHLAAVRDIFDLAGIEFGRIDYGMFQGSVQTWEINSNPTIIYPPELYTARQMPAKLEFTQKLADKLREMARATG